MEDLKAEERKNFMKRKFTQSQTDSYKLILKDPSLNMNLMYNL